MKRTRALLAALLLAQPHHAFAARVSLIVPGGSAAVRAGPDVIVLAFDRERLGDPIEKGRFLAALHASDRVVSAAGAPACVWLGRELEGPGLQCLDSYDPAPALDFARAAGWRRVAAVHTKNYESFFIDLRAAARRRGVELADVRIENLRDLPAALPRALNSAEAVWILGDSALTEGAAFEYAVKTSLSRKIPLIAPGNGLVARGAFLGIETDRAAMLRHAVGVANAAAKGQPAGSAADVPAGRLVVNEVLARRWGVRVPGGPR